MEPMRILEVGMHWFPDGGGGAVRYFVLELVREDPLAGNLSSVKADNALKFQKCLRHLAFPRRDLAIVVAKLCPKFESIERRRAGQRESPGTGYIVERSLQCL
jgi:hypothetical protein